MFPLEYPKIEQGDEIEKLSLQKVEEEMLSYKDLVKFSREQRHIIQRMIHATTCAEKIISSLVFHGDAPQKIFKQLQNGATIVCDTKMIEVGLSSRYLQKYNNQVICHVSRPDIIEEAAQKKTTRSYVAVQKALQECTHDTPHKEIILACGNAPTFLYAAIHWLLTNNFNPQQISFLALPVGYINVKEAKEYALRYLQKFNVSGIVLRGNYGSSSLVVSALHAIYRLEQIQ